jgi:PAS domain S-box-containing protein
MSSKLLRQLLLPRSLRWQFKLVLSVQALLIVAGAITAVYGLRMSADATRQFADAHLVHLQQSQDLVQCALLIERESNRMLTVDSIDTMQASYQALLKRLDLLDTSVQRLGQSSNNLAVLALNQVNQLFRNTLNIVAQLRKNLLADTFARSELARQRETFLTFSDELQRQVVSLVDSARDLSAKFTLDHQKMLLQLTHTAARDQWRVMTLLAGSILLAWLVSGYFLRRRVLARLQQVSNCLRLGETWCGFPTVPEKGDDEIGEMASAVDQFLEDRRLLVQTQRNLRQNEELLRAIIEAAPVAIIGLDLHGNVHSVWNRAAERMLGWSASEVMGNLHPMLQDEETEKVRWFREELRNGITLNGVEVQRHRRDGTPIEYCIYASPLRNPEGNITGYITVLVDISERKLLEDRLRRKNKDLEYANAELAATNRELEAFAYSVSHDLRAPLRHIDGFIELLKKSAETVLDQQSRHYMASIADAAQKMGLLVDHLLSFSRMGRQALSLQRMDLKVLVREVIQELEPDAAGRNIDWRIGELPAIDGDASMLRIVLTNLIANALKFTRPRQQAQIEIGSISENPSEVVIFIRDNGVGFDMAYVNKLFGVFHRLHRADEFEGTGIGLANVQRIISRHGGRTWADGKPDQGAVFFFSLPRIPPAGGAEKPWNGAQA